MLGDQRELIHRSVVRRAKGTESFVYPCHKLRLLIKTGERDAERVDLA